MKRVVDCVRFTFSATWKMCLIFVAIYAFSAWVLPSLFFILTPTSEMSTGGGMWMFGIVYMFLICYILYKQLFNNLLIFGNTRATLFGGVVTALVLNALVLAVCAPLLDYTTEVISNIVGYTYFNSFAFLFPEISTSSEILLYFSFNITALGIGLFLGSLAYKFGKRSIMFFWLGFFVFANLLGTVVSQRDSDGATPVLNPLLNALLSGGPWSPVIVCCMVGVLFGVVAWLMARRQPLRV